jgi:hypothetical protein
LHFDLDRLECLVFNPIEHSALAMDCLTMSSVDPDLNVQALLPPTSRYMVENDISDLIDETMSMDDTGFSLLHLNCRSLIGNFDKFKVLTRNLHKSFSIIGVSETWLNDETSDLVNFSGYNFISNHRLSKVGGRVGLYLQNHFQYKLIQECTISNPEVIESLFLEIANPNGKNIIVGTIYRLPNQNLTHFMEEFNKILSFISKDNKQCLYYGRFRFGFIPLRSACFHSRIHGFFVLLHVYYSYK